MPYIILHFHNKAIHSLQNQLAKSFLFGQDGHQRRYMLNQFECLFDHHEEQT